MITIVLLAGGILVVAALLLIFRILTLLDVAKGKERVDSANKTNAVLFVVFLVVGFTALFIYSKMASAYFLPKAASEHGVITDQLFWITITIIMVVFVITHILLFYFSYKYQHKDGNKAHFYPHNNKLELIWTVVPAIVLAVLVISGWRAWSKITSKPPVNAEEVEIMGYQFAWKVRYPGRDKMLGKYDFRLIDATNEWGMDLSDQNSFDDFTPSDKILRIPKGQPVLFKIRSKDVIHSVFAPHFRLKMDAVPGMPTRFWFIPTKTTQEMREELGNPQFNYEIACAEVCGKGHFSMRMIVVVEELEDYKKWFVSQPSWFSKNPSYLDKVPDNLKDMAKMMLLSDTTVSK